MSSGFFDGQYGKILRRGLRQGRQALNAKQRFKAAEGLAQQLLALPFAGIRGYVGGYWANDGEIALNRWQMQLHPEQIYCLPILNEENKTLRFVPWKPGEPLRTNRYGIPEPAIDDPDDPMNVFLPQDMSMVAIPLTGFTSGGQRLGMGGGWYDRSFAFRQRCPAPPWLVGVGFSIQKRTYLPLNRWDVMMDAICTEKATFLCSDQAKNSSKNKAL